MHAQRMCFYWPTLCGPVTGATNLGVPGAHESHSQLHAEYDCLTYSLVYKILHDLVPVYLDNPISFQPLQHFLYSNST